MRVGVGEVKSQSIASDSVKPSKARRTVIGTTGSLWDLDLSVLIGLWPGFNSLLIRLAGVVCLFMRLSWIVCLLGCTGLSAY